MSESAHTPGPWTAEKETGLGYLIQPTGASVPDHYEEYHADARLIAAAPELLAGLQDLFKMMDEELLVRNTQNDADSGWAIKQLRFVSRLAKAQDAIAKATTPTH